MKNNKTLRIYVFILKLNIYVESKKSSFIFNIDIYYLKQQQKKKY
jgi:hypothetical protein